MRAELLDKPPSVDDELAETRRRMDLAQAQLDAILGRHPQTAKKTSSASSSSSSTRRKRPRRRVGRIAARS